jgi:hypothetical protein
MATTKPRVRGVGIRSVESPRVEDTSVGSQPCAGAGMPGLSLSSLAPQQPAERPDQDNHSSYSIRESKPPAGAQSGWLPYTI